MYKPMFSKENQVGFFGKKHKKGFKLTTADKWFSKFIRLRGVFLVKSPSEAYCKCITCGKIIHWKKRSPEDKLSADCGHFATRGHPMTRFDERNANVQCKSCNNYGKGEQAKHVFCIDKIYGRGTAERLIELSEIRGQKELTKLALDDIAKEYRLKAKALAKKIGVDINSKWS